MQDFEQIFLEALQGKRERLKAQVLSPDFEERFNIYQNSIIATLQQTLFKIFKPLEALIGVEAFQELCLRYAQSHPSQGFNLNHYGKELSHFIKDAPYIQDFPYLPDFIDFCYLWQQTYLGTNLKTDPVCFDYPVYEIWQRCQPEFSGDKAIDDWQGPFNYLLYRESDRVMVAAVAPHAR